MQTSQFMQKANIRNVDTDINMEIDSVAKFILYKVAIDYLANDLELCLNICSTNLSFVANCNLFEGNILRFKGLALEKMYEQKTKEEKEDEEEKDGKHAPKIEEEDPKDLICDAIEAVKNAISIFSNGYDKSLRSKVQSSSHGLALAGFQYGCLLETYSQDLLADFGNVHLTERLGKLQLSNMDQCHREARKCFEKAYKDFEQLNHLKGMYLSKKHLHAVQTSELRVATEVQVKEMRQKYREYVHENGLSQSCSILRE